jgi:hypothetical protein
MYKQILFAIITAHMVLSVKLISTTYSRVIGCDTSNYAIVALPSCGEVITNVILNNNICRYWFNHVEIIQVIYYADKPCSPISYNYI